eukprot:54390_1
MALLCYLMISVLFYGLSLSDYVQTFYVSSTTGSDGNNGNKSQPFQTLDRARNAIRALKINNKNKLPVGGVLVLIRGGNYYQLNYTNYDEPLLQLNASQDSGDIDAPIIYSGYQNETVNIIGGYKIPSNAFKPSNNYTNLLVANLTEINADLWQKVKYGNIKSANGNLGYCGNLRSELFVNEKRMILARWPNIYHNQTVYPNVDIFNWTNIQNVTNNQTSFTYKFDDNRANKWNKDLLSSNINNSLWLHGYWGFDWADSYTQIESIDISTKTINTYNTTLPIYFYKNNARFYGVNILSELDNINEYYLDTINHLVYINKLRSNTLDIDEYYISVNPQLITITSSSHSPDIQYITIQNVRLLYAISNAIGVYNGGNITISNVSISCIGENAIYMNGYNNLLSNNIINNIGCSGMILSGGVESSLTRGNNVAINNHITYYSEWKRTYKPGISWKGVGNNVIKNYVGFAPHFGMSGNGNDWLFKQNIFERLCYETSDSGGWYSGHSWAYIGHHIDNNTFINIYNIEPIAIGQQNVHGIHLDDQLSYINITNNLFINTHYGIRLGGGRGVNIENNKFAAQLYGVMYDDRGLTWQSTDCQPGGFFEQQLKSLNYQKPPWSEHYPFLVNIMNEQPCVPVYDTIKSNTFCCVKGYDCHFIDDSNQTCTSWNSTCNHNEMEIWNNVCSYNHE